MRCPCFSSASVVHLSTVVIDGAAESLECIEEGHAEEFALPSASLHSVDAPDQLTLPDVPTHVVAASAPEYSSISDPQDAAASVHVSMEEVDLSEEDEETGESAHVEERVVVSIPV